MSAIACQIKECQGFEVDIHDAGMFARGVRVLAERRCPHCNSVVYSRRHKLCGVCAEELPDACLFSADQVQRVQSLLQEERQRHRMWMQRYSN